MPHINETLLNETTPAYLNQTYEGEHLMEKILIEMNFTEYSPPIADWLNTTMDFF